MLENMHRIQQRMDQLRNDCQTMHHHKLKPASKTFATELNKAVNGKNTSEKTFASSIATNSGDKSDFANLIHKYSKKKWGRS